MKRLYVIRSRFSSCRPENPLAASAERYSQDMETMVVLRGVKFFFHFLSRLVEILVALTRKTFPRQGNPPRYPIITLCHRVYLLKTLKKK